MGCQSLNHALTEPSMALIPCEMREENSAFLYLIDKKNSTSPTYLYTSGRHKKEINKVQKGRKILYKKGKK